MEVIGLNYPKSLYLYSVVIHYVPATQQPGYTRYRTLTSLFPAPYNCHRLLPTISYPRVSQDIR